MISSPLLLALTWKTTAILRYSGIKSSSLKYLNVVSNMYVLFFLTIAQIIPFIYLTWLTNLTNDHLRNSVFTKNGCTWHMIRHISKTNDIFWCKYLIQMMILVTGIKMNDVLWREYPHGTHETKSVIKKEVCIPQMAVFETCGSNGQKQMRILCNAAVIFTRMWSQTV